MKAFCFRAVCACLRPSTRDHILKVREHYILQTACGIFTMHILRCSLEQRWTNYILRSKGQYLTITARQYWSNKHLENTFSSISGMQVFKFTHYQVYKKVSLKVMGSRNNIFKHVSLEATPSIGMLRGSPHLPNTSLRAYLDNTVHNQPKKKLHNYTNCKLHSTYT